MASNAASAAFYFAGALALAVAAPLTIRRFLLEQPFSTFWEHEVGGCRLRQLQQGEEARRFVYSVVVRVTNRSKARQAVVRGWIGVFLPGEGKWADSTGVFGSAEEADQFFYGTPPVRGSFEISPDESFGIGQAVISSSLEHAVRVTYCFEVRKRRLFGCGFHRTTIMESGSQTVAVDLDDIRYYSSSRAT